MKARQVFVYYRDGNPEDVAPTEFPIPYQEDGILFREVLPDEPDWKNLAEELAEALETSIDELRVTSNLKYEYGINILAKYRKATGDK